MHSKLSSPVIILQLYPWIVSNPSISLSNSVELLQQSVGLISSSKSLYMERDSSLFMIDYTLKSKLFTTH